MGLEAIIAGIGFSAFLSLYACFQISPERMIEKSLLYFIGLSSIIVIPFLLLSDSLETGSDIGYLSIFFEKYFIFAIIAFIAVVAVFMLHILEKRVGVLVGDKDGKE